MVTAAPPFTGNASQLLDLHRESLARFEAVTLTQRLMNGRKTLSLFIEVTVDNTRRRRRRRQGNVKKKKDRQRKPEKKRLKEVVPHPLTSLRIPPLPCHNYPPRH